MPVHLRTSNPVLIHCLVNVGVAAVDGREKIKWWKVTTCLVMRPHLLSLPLQRGHCLTYLFEGMTNCPPDESSNNDYVIHGNARARDHCTSIAISTTLFIKTRWSLATIESGTSTLYYSCRMKYTGMVLFLGVSRLQVLIYTAIESYIIPKYYTDSLFNLYLFCCSPGLLSELSQLSELVNLTYWWLCGTDLLAELILQT